ncbi:hypothetical protein HDU97_004776 [Phlyctochytrium planicorne]|nr:hypothetical protein HDU97_004776 [Phlyctochytrium planicorne]
MFAIKSIILGSAVSALALPAAPNVSPAYESRLVHRSFDGTFPSVEPIMMLMHCDLTKDGQIESQYSDIGLYESEDASKDGSIPAHYVGVNVINDLSSFEAPFRADFNDGRDFRSYISNSNVDTWESIGGSIVGYRPNDSTYVRFKYDCTRDNDRHVFGADVGDRYADCYAFAYLLSAETKILPMGIGYINDNFVTRLLDDEKDVAGEDSNQDVEAEPRTSARIAELDPVIREWSNQDEENIETKLRKSLLKAWHTIPEIDYKRKQKDYGDDEIVTTVDWPSMHPWGYTTHHVFHSVCFGFLKKSLECHNIPLRALVKALKAPVPSQFQYLLVVNNAENKAPHDPIILSSCQPFIQPKLSRLWAFAIPDAITLTQEEDEEHLYQFDPSSVPRGDFMRKLTPAESRLVFTSRNADPALTWRQWVHNSYWFLDTVLLKSPISLNPRQRPPQTTTAIFVPTDPSPSFFLGSIVGYISSDDLIDLESTCSGIRYNRNEYWKVLCKRDGVPCVPGEEKAFFQAREKAVKNWKAVYFCGSSLNRKRINEIVSWTVKVLKKMDETGQYEFPSPTWSDMMR